MPFLLNKKIVALLIILILGILFDAYLISSTKEPILASPEIVFEEERSLPKDQNLRIAMLQLYLRSLYYYDGPITGKSSWALVNALSLFQKKRYKKSMVTLIGPQPPLGFLPKIDLTILRKKYWELQPAIPLTQPYKILIKKQGLYAQGGWGASNDPGGLPWGGSRITCVWKTKTCIEVYERTSFRSVPFLPTFSPTIVMQHYKIHSQSNHFVEAETTQEEPEALLSEDMISKPISRCQKAILSIDLDRRIIEKNIVNDIRNSSEFCTKARKAKNMFASEHSYTLRDTRASQLEFGFNKYWSQTLSGQFFPNGSIQSRLFDWLANDALQRAKKIHKTPSDS